MERFILIIDFHVHAFPDGIARRAMSKMEKEAGFQACLDGTLDQLLSSLERARIERAVLLPIATRPGQESTINNWAASVRGNKLISFGSIHPFSKDWREQLALLVEREFIGVKLHPDFQGFYVDDPRVFPFYEALCRTNMIVVFHAGVDLCMPSPCHATPAGLRRVIEEFPEGCWVAAHMGGYLLWNEVAEHLVGRKIYFDTSYCLPSLDPAKIIELIRAHGPDRILFGTDSPWSGQKDALERIKSLSLTAGEKEMILGGNARRLLHL